jgi:hypothetical protein
MNNTSQEDGEKIKCQVRANKNIRMQKHVTHHCQHVSTPAEIPLGHWNDKIPDFH